MTIVQRIKPILLSASLLFSVATFSQSHQSADNHRAAIIYKQSHSANILQPTQSKLLADGIKLKMNIDALKDAGNENICIDENEIPAEDVYDGLWQNHGVNAYGSIVNMPDSFQVNLSNFTIPSPGYITSNFGRRGRHRYHYGIDIKLQTGDTVYAAFDGKVRVKEVQARGYGKFIVLRHTNGLETVYGHLSKFLVEENQVVMSGDPIALGGNTGRSTGSHLHFETRFLGRPIDPNFLIDFENKVCHRDSYVIRDNSFYKTTRSSRMRYSAAARDNYIKSVKKTNKFVSGKVKYHRVKRGDTLGAIARRYGVSVSKICSLNNISSRAKLRPGKSLRVA